MAEENLDVLRALFPAPIDLCAVFAAPELIEAMRSQFEPLFQPDFKTVHDPKAVPLGIGGTLDGGISVGVQGFIALWRDYLSAWESWVITPIDFIEVGDARVLVLLDYQGRSKTHGAQISLAGGNLFTLHEGKVARLELFFARQDALAAAGL
jgi:SnoaL-like protein